MTWTKKILAAIVAAAIAYPVGTGLAASGGEEAPTPATDPEVQAELTELQESRRRGLTYMVETIREHGSFPEDQEQLAEAEAELEAVGGPDPAHVEAAKQEAQSLISPEEDE